jgi:hypothetical protein
VPQQGARGFIGFRVGRAGQAQAGDAIEQGGLDC